MKLKGLAAYWHKTLNKQYHIGDHNRAIGVYIGGAAALLTYLVVHMLK